MKVREKRMLKIKQAIERAGKMFDVTALDWIDDFTKIARMERKYQRLQEAACNGYPKTITEFKNGKHFRYDIEDIELKAKCEKQEENIEKKLQEIAQRRGWFIRTQGDPRGATVQVDFFQERTENEECSHTQIFYV